MVQSFRDALTAGYEGLKESLDNGSNVMLVSDGPEEVSGAAIG